MCIRDRGYTNWYSVAKIVKDEIYENLKPICSSLEIGETVTVSAGKIQHLKTEFKGTSEASCQEIVDVLFPTSAIAGLPKDEAFAEISRSENHDRSFYSGFLGQIENDRSFSFVNLRCFNLKSDVLSLYVGSGITQKSDPEKEWKEILKKSAVLPGPLAYLSKKFQNIEFKIHIFASPQITLT